jgi:inosine-uridine nucleoside N-ribohydrolase
MRFGRAFLIGALALSAILPVAARAARPIVIIDTDVGDDIDDAYALAWALSSPKLDVRLITASFGDTALRARMLRRMLGEIGRGNVAIGAGPATPPATVFTQAHWASDAPRDRGGEIDAIALTLDLIRAHPGRVTLIALAPLTTIRPMIARDPATFRKLKRVLVMGGSIRRGYDKGGKPSPVPDAEYNTARDPGGLRALLASGVPVTLFPLDSTQVRPDDATLTRWLGAGTHVAKLLAALTAEWRTTNPWKQTVPTLFDAVPVAAAIDPKLCPTQPLHIEVDDKGFTRAIPGSANALACLISNGPAVVARIDEDISPIARSH